jgi:hypothetical protein
MKKSLLDPLTIYRSFRMTQKVPCSEPHLVEVVRNFEQDGSAFDASGPTPGQWSVIRDQSCGPMVATYLGYALDPYGRFHPGLIKPTSEGWKVGQRSVLCGVELYRASGSSPDGGLDEFSGAAKGADQTLLYGVGACFPMGTTDGFGPEVRCTDPHAVEVTGTVDVTGKLSAYPQADGWQAVVGDQCTKLAESIYGGPLPAGVRGDWLTLAPSSWDAGRRLVECTIAQHGADGSFVTVTAPLRR